MSCGINKSVSSLTNGVYLSEKVAQQIIDVFFRKKKMPFTSPTESRLSSLLEEECLYFLGMRKL